MAPSKQQKQQGKGKELVLSPNESDPTRLVSELEEGGGDSSPRSTEMAEMRKVQAQLLYVFF